MLAHLRLVSHLVLNRPKVLHRLIHLLLDISVNLVRLHNGNPFPLGLSGALLLARNNTIVQGVFVLLVRDRGHLRPSVDLINFQGRSDLNDIWLLLSLSRNRSLV